MNFGSAKPRGSMQELHKFAEPAPTGGVHAKVQKRGKCKVEVVVLCKGVVVLRKREVVVRKGEVVVRKGEVVV